MIEVNYTRSLLCLRTLTDTPVTGEAVIVYGMRHNLEHCMRDDCTVGRWDKLTPKFPLGQTASIHYCC
ncbi:MAG: hypothetical protein JW901_10360 [Dehalococcoidia bacterium]|nr:hypothetical protein [Dehalococcoidia bacterium]